MFNLPHFVGPDLGPIGLQRFTLQLVDLTFCMLGNISGVLMSADLFIFFKILFKKKLFQECYHSVKQFGLRSGLTFCQV